MVLPEQRRTDYAWDKLFRYSNQRRGKPDFGYSPGEKIAIKVNLVMGLAGGYGSCQLAPALHPSCLSAILSELIDELQIPGRNDHSI